MSYQGGILEFEPSVTTAGILVWRELNDRSCFYLNRALNITSKLNGLTTCRFQATIISQHRLSVGRGLVFSGKIEVKLIL